jgi:CBS domain-containing protein
MKSKAKDIMCRQPQCCTPEDTIQDAARMMEQCDCGAIPVLEGDSVKKAVGIITDRDIACRAIALGRGPQTKVRECMTTPVAAVGEDSTVGECCDTMERAKVRRLLVTDSEGELCGIISQADIALRLSKNLTAEVVKEVSKPAEGPTPGAS